MPPAPHTIVRSLPQHLWRVLPIARSRTTSSALGLVRCSPAWVDHVSGTQRRCLHIPINTSGMGDIPQKTSEAAVSLRVSDKADARGRKVTRRPTAKADNSKSRRLRRRATERAAMANKGPSSVTAAPEAVAAEPVATATEVKGETISGSVTDETAVVTRVKPPFDAKVAKLRKSLHRVLFRRVHKFCLMGIQLNVISPGVHFIRDPRTGTQNFEPALEDIPKPEEFAFHRCPSYITPSGDKSLANLARNLGCRFLGSTSSLTQALSNIYFALSGGKGINVSTMSIGFMGDRTDFTAGAGLPASLVLTRLFEDQPIYAVDSDKSYDVENVLSDYGRVLEKILTAEEADFQRFLKSSPESAVSEEERNEREAYSYCRTDSMLMRSQLDCYDPRMPGSGVFDIKTRAVFPIRHDRANYRANSVYDIALERGKGATFERELWDLSRSGMLKYSMQARIGGMDGVFCAYHNTQRLLGFQYLPLSEMDERLYGSTELGDLTFRYCVKLLEAVLTYATDKVPAQKLSVIMKHFATGVDIAFWSQDDPADKHGVRLAIENLVDGERVKGELQYDPLEVPRSEWTVKYTLEPLSATAVEKIESNTKKTLTHMAVLSVPEGKTVEDMSKSKDENAPSITKSERDPKTPAVLQWREPSKFIRDIREMAKENGREYEKRRASWVQDGKAGQPEARA